jgi:hypothetical protein
MGHPVFYCYEWHMNLWYAFDNIYWPTSRCCARWARLIENFRPPLTPVVGSEPESVLPIELVEGILDDHTWKLRGLTPSFSSVFLLFFRVGSGMSSCCKSLLKSLGKKCFEQITVCSLISKSGRPTARLQIAIRLACLGSLIGKWWKLMCLPGSGWSDWEPHPFTQHVAGILGEYPTSRARELVY